MSGPPRAADRWLGRGGYRGGIGGPKGSYVRKGDTRLCPTCEGTGINPQARYMVCPKCKGEKRVPVKRFAF